MTTSRQTSRTRRSFKMNGPLNSIRVRAGKAGVRVDLNGQTVAEAMNAPGPAATSAPPSDPHVDPHDANGLGSIATGRFVEKQKKPVQGLSLTKGNAGNGNNGELPIGVGPITPVP